MKIASAIKLAIAVVLLGVAGYLLYPQLTSLLTVPCTTPLAYTVTSIDSRFGTSDAAVRAALKDAEELWEEAAGRDLFTASDEGIAVRLVYGEEQKANELGAVIDTEQATYDAKKAELETLKDAYNTAKDTYEARADAFDARAARYHEEVAKRNREGGASPEDYERLEQERKALEAEQDTLNGMATEVNEAADSLNDAVDALNALAKKLNRKVSTYNEQAGDPFDQGDYQEDASGKRITVYEFSDGTDLRRVLAHELGHALGMNHVEDPGSIMYSFNAGPRLVLTDDDISALREVCRLDK